MPSFKAFKQQKILQIEEALDKRLPTKNIEPSRLHQAMRYSTLNGGKRIRAMLVYATGHLLEQPNQVLNDIACAIELIHAYSLIHDDLPSMDNDDLRRGKPSCHMQFDEATAILAGDALLTLSFEVLSGSACTAVQKVNLIQLLAHASGSSGMVGGQAIDLANEGKIISSAELQHMHHHKTGALIASCITLVASLTFKYTSVEYQNLKKYAELVGLAFQVQDDILDQTSTTGTLGKTQGKDSESNKSTYLSMLGLPSSKKLTQRLYADAISSLSCFGNQADYLRDIAKFTVSRLT